MSKLADWLIPENDDGSGVHITPDVLASGGFRGQMKGNGSGDDGAK